jgi:hypothetical protein
LDDFLALLGNSQRDVQVALEEVEDRLPGVLRVVLPAATHVPRAIFGADFNWERFRYSTEVKAARPIEVFSSRRYQQEQEAITVVNASWEIVADCFQLETDDEIGPVLGYQGVRLTGSIQFYLPDDPDLLPQVVSARLQAEDLPQPVRGVGG